MAIMESFLPDLLGSDLSCLESELLCRPTRFGGIGVHDPVKIARNQFETSKKATSCLSKAIQDGTVLDLNLHEETVRRTIKEKKELMSSLRDETLALVDQFPEHRKRCVMRKLDHKCSGWLSVLPTEINQFQMSAPEFRDALALRYGRTPNNLPSRCDADGEVFDLNHALNCAKGGLVYARHNELRDLNCSLLELAGLKQIISEPVVYESDEESLRADWAARGFWEPQKLALFDGCVINADSNSLEKLSLETIFNQRRNIKNNTYLEAANARRATFTPILATCDAVFDNEAENYFKRMAVHLSKKWDSNYSQTISYVRARMQICILRSTSLCLRGCRTKWRGAGLEDGTTLSLFRFNGNE